MKHISTFKLFESNESITNRDRIAIRKYLEDILIELCDIGYNDYISIYNDDITITLTKPRVEDHGLFTRLQEFEYSEVKDCIWSCIDYMEGNGYVNNVFLCKRDLGLGSNLVKVNSEGQNVQMLLHSVEVKFKDALVYKQKNDRISV